MKVIPQSAHIRSLGTRPDHLLETFERTERTSSKLTFRQKPITDHKPLNLQFATFPMRHHYCCWAWVKLWREGRGAGVIFVIGVGRVQRIQNLTQKYNRRKTIPKNVMFSFLFKPKISFSFFFIIILTCLNTIKWIRKKDFK